MNPKIKSFQDNIRRTFILFSMTPVFAVAVIAIGIFLYTWNRYTAIVNRQDNQVICQKIDDTLGIYYGMFSDMQMVLMAQEDSVEETLGVGYLNPDGTKVTNPVRNKLYQILYERTGDLEDTGNMMILSPKQEVLFCSKGSAPAYLTQREYRNWGVFYRIQNSPNEVSSILYDGTLYLVKGIFVDHEMKYAMVYQVPKQVITAIVNQQNRYCIITDRNGWIYLNNMPGMSDEFGQIQDSAWQETGLVTVDGKKYFTYNHRLMKGLTIFTFSDVNRSQKLVLVIIGIIAVLFAGIVLITFWTTARSSEVYTRDVKEIESAFEAVQQGDFDVSLHMDSSQEFQTIGNDFNEMLEGLKAQIEENKELAEHAAFSQVKQLESQFNPHFLFNTLDNIRFMAKIDADAADKMILSLSGLLRYSIREVREEVTVKEDLEYLQNYLNILQIRFNKRFAYEMDVSPDIYDCVIPKLIIQPLLENAVKYGFDENKKLSVKLKGYQNKDQVVFICEDDGAGIEEELLQELQRQMTGDENTGTHLGLYNINRRIQLMYGQDYGVYLDSEKGRGTMVRLVLPKKRNESCTEC